LRTGKKKRLYGDSEQERFYGNFEITVGERCHGPDVRETHEIGLASWPLTFRRTIFLRADLSTFPALLFLPVVVVDELRRNF